MLEPFADLVGFELGDAAAFGPEVAFGLLEVGRELVALLFELGEAFRVEVVDLAGGVVDFNDTEVTCRLGAHHSSLT